MAPLHPKRRYIHYAIRLLHGYVHLAVSKNLTLMEIIEDRHGQKATIIISQLPVADWYDVMKGNTTAADAILDRLVHTSVRFELKGASLRQKNVSYQTENRENV